jgi:hypothetical protein
VDGVNHSRLVLLTLAGSAALGGSAAGRSDATGSGPMATTSTAFLTVAEARQETRREVFRIARKREEEVKDFEIKWCRRRSAVTVGCRYEMWLPVEWRAAGCHGGARVTEGSRNRHQTRAWRYCVLETDG